MLNLFLSKKTFLTLTLSWILIILFSYIILPPAIDDLFYFWPSLNFYYENRVGMYEGNTFTTTFFQFPTFSVIQGFFLNIYGILNINIDNFSYRFFQKLLLTLLFVVTFFFINQQSETVSKYFKINLFLILITFTPFTLGLVGSVRPEVLGILLVITSLLIFNHLIIKNKMNEKFKFYIASFLLGTAFTIHPQFFVITSFSGLIILYEFYKRTKNFTLIFSFAFFFLISPSIIFIWYYLSFPESLDFIFNRVEYIGTSPLLVVKKNFVNLFNQSFLISESSILVKLYQAIFTLPYLIMIFLCIILIFKSSFNNKLNFIQKVFISIFLSSFVNFTFINMYDFYHGVFAYFTILTLCFLIKNPILSLEKFEYKKKFIAIFFVFIFLFNSLFIIMHSSKYIFSNQKYYNMKSTLKKISPFLIDDTVLILTSEKLFGTFVGYFEKFYLINQYNKIYFLFPFPDAGPTNIQYINAKVFLKNHLMNFKPIKTIIAAEKKYVKINKDQKDLELILNGGFKIFIKYNKIYFEDKDHIFINFEKISLIN